MVSEDLANESALSEDEDARVDSAASDTEAKSDRGSIIDIDDNTMDSILSDKSDSESESSGDESEKEEKTKKMGEKFTMSDLGEYLPDISMCFPIIMVDIY